jgi:hypothetical protein
LNEEIKSLPTELGKHNIGAATVADNLAQAELFGGWAE